jgi:pimeloyl-ACP methyl ester carboxylesterase
MGLKDYAKLGLLLSRIAKPESVKAIAQTIQVDRDQVSSEGVSFDRFNPQKPSSRIVIALPGVSINSKEDKRLQHFALCLALSGATCITPCLPQLAQLVLDPADIQTLVAIIKDLPLDNELILVGFSYAASYTLVAACRPEVRDRIKCVLAFGGYHRLAGLHAVYQAAQNTPFENLRAWEDLVYLHMVLAYRNRVQLNLSNKLQEDLGNFLKRYCHSNDMNEKVAFYRQHLERLDLLKVDQNTQDPQNLEALSPAGKLQQLRCQVGLIHDPEDYLIPSDHSRQLADELSKAGISHRLIITSLLNHVEPSGILKFRDLTKLMKTLTPLVV